MFKEKRFLVIGAHPDDPDIMFGGTALKLSATGHRVKFVSCCNGDCGHFSMKPEDLAACRYQEAQASAKIAGVEEYQVLNHSDCTLEASLANRKQIVEIIRKFQPDVVISHRMNDYHADHRAAAQLVQDASYLVTVPLYCPETLLPDVPMPEIYPVFAYSWDHFQSPRPFRADAKVIIDDVLDLKLAMLDCHKSQFYEWLPWNNKGLRDFDINKMTADEKRQWLLDNWICRNIRQAELFAKNGEAAYLETFEHSEYGKQVSKEEFAALFSS